MDVAILLEAKPRSRLLHWVTLAGLAGGVIVCTAIVHRTGGTAAGYTYLMLVPIMLGAAFYGLAGGLSLALAGSVLLGPSMPLDVMLQQLQPPIKWLIRSGIFLLVGGVAGALFGFVRRSARQQHLAARTDPTTGMPNQVALREDLASAIADLPASKNLSFILVRATDLAELVDVVGIDGGDRVMRSIGKSLEKIGPQLSKAYRYSSTDLALIAKTANQTELQELVQKIHDRASASFQIDQAPVRIEPVLGVGHNQLHAGIVPEELIRRSRVAMRRALSREHSWVTYEPRFESDQGKTLVLISRVRAALEAGEFELHYQPKIRLADRTLAGVEALSRWRQGDGTVVLPSAFMPKLEQTSLIEHLTRFVIREAVDRAHHSPWAPIAINFAARNLADDRLTKELLACLDETGTAGDLIEIEVTESALMNDPETAILLLHTLRERGVGISIDDFGTGYSSFAYLQRLPATNLKIDRSFIAQLEKHDTSRRLVQAMIEAGHSLGLTVTAEGVETEAQAAMLTRLGCDLGQGFLWSPGRPAEQISQWQTAQAPPPATAATSTA